MAGMQFEELGVDRAAVALAITYVDHNVLGLDHRNMDDARYLQAFCARYGLLYSRPGNGISHYIHLERYARPGQGVVGAGPPPPTAGGGGGGGGGAGGRGGGGGGGGGARPPPAPPRRGRRAG